MTTGYIFDGMMWREIWHKPTHNASARHKPSPSIDVLGPASAEAGVVPAHCGDRGLYVTSLLQPLSNDNRNHRVKNARNLSAQKTYPRDSQFGTVVSKMAPLPRPAITEPDEPEEDHETEEDWGEHEEDFDPDMDQAQAWNDYQRDLES